MRLRTGVISLAIWSIIANLATGAEPAAVETAAARSLFDGKSLAGWKVTDFGGQGEVHVEDGQIILEMGSDLTGVTIDSPEPLPTMNYEVSLEAMRVAGNDFFCGLTFPVRDSFCSLIVGGWGGGLVGISSLDGKDASENQTGDWHELNKNKWYRIRLQVLEKRILAWIDDKLVVDAETEGKEIGVRSEVKLSQPLGFSTWRTTGALRDIHLKSLTKKEIEKSEKTADEEEE